MFRGSPPPDLVFFGTGVRADFFGSCATDGFIGRVSVGKWALAMVFLLFSISSLTDGKSGIPVGRRTLALGVPHSRKIAPHLPPRRVFDVILSETREALSTRTRRFFGDDFCRKQGEHSQREWWLSNFLVIFSSNDFAI